MVGKSKLYYSISPHTQNKFPKNYIFMIIQDWDFCDQILQALAILDNKLITSSSFFKL